jgi:predicted anti-sigma-YlaC factor YlaD
MNDIGCERARELIPLLSAGALQSPDRTSVEAHLGRCSECRQEAELARLLFATRPTPPPDMAERITAAVRQQGRAVRRPWWGLSAAAVAVLALGIGVLSNREVVPISVPVYAADAGQSELWLSDDGLIAGAPSFEALSDEALEQLLNELGPGGAA